MREEQQIFSVTQVNTYIKDLLEHNGFLTHIFIRGEISNYKAYPSGHHYFSLKDETGALRGVMFRREAVRLKFRPENGMKVIAFGHISAFPRDGQYQLICSDLTPDGVGDLHVAFEQLKAKLQEAGLFDLGHKKSIPAYPQKIVLITSSAGAAIQDMLRVLGARFPLAEILLIPVRVQGSEAADEIARALRYTSANRLGDLIITGRGGGSMEDLWCFNDERVARAIYDCEIPVISAVGHEPDVTIADFVADLRAATPSNGAELAVPDQNELYANLGYLEDRMISAMERRLAQNRQTLHRLSKCRELENPLAYLQNRRETLQSQRKCLSQAMEQALLRQHSRLGRTAASLDALSPLAVLARGYAYTQDADGNVITSTQQIQQGDSLVVHLKDGILECLVENRRIT